MLLEVEILLGYMISMLPAFFLADKKASFRHLLCLGAVLYGACTLQSMAAGAWLRANPQWSAFAFLTKLPFPAANVVIFVTVRFHFKLAAPWVAYVTQNLYQDLNYAGLYCLLTFDLLSGMAGISAQVAGYLAGLVRLLTIAIGNAFIINTIKTLKPLDDLNRPPTISGSKHTLAVLGWSTLVTMAVFALTGLSVWFISQEGANRFAIGAYTLLILAGAHLVQYAVDSLTLARKNIRLKDAYIASLTRTIDDFTGFRHDINNMLQIYDGYLVTQQYDELRAYHRRLLRDSRDANYGMDAMQRLGKNPVLLGLLMEKQRFAEATGVTYRFTTVPTNDLPAMCSMDFGRILGNLLNNAFEEALLSETPCVNLSMTREPDSGHVSIELTNSTAGDVDVSKIFTKGYSTKRLHSGQGLWEISKALSRTDLYTLHCSYSNRTFTALLTVRIGRTGTVDPSA